MRKRLLLSLALLASAFACKEADSTILVNVSTNPDVAPIHSLRAAMSSAQAHDIKVYPAQPSATALPSAVSFVIIVPRARTGRLDLAVDGVDSVGSNVAHGAGQTTIVVGGSATASVALIAGPSLCGNGLLDPGETCDDINQLSFDGCDFRCQTESPPPDAAAPVADSQIGETLADTTADSPSSPDAVAASLDLAREVTPELAPDSPENVVDAPAADSNAAIETNPIDTFGAGDVGVDRHGTGTGGITSSGGTLGSGGSPGTGGAAGTGGAIGTGGSTGTCGWNGRYDCGNACVPANGTIGGVTDFTDANGSNWGPSSALHGTIFTYAGGTTGMMNSPKVEGTPVGLHLTGSVSSTGYAGGGITFLTCATVASFTSVQFDVYGSAPGCHVDLKFQTFDQRPSNLSPPGGCLLTDGGTACSVWPTASQVVDISTAAIPSSSPRTVVTPLSSFVNWAAGDATRIVAMQWLFTASGAGSSAFPIDVTITNIKFVP